MRGHHLQVSGPSVVKPRMCLHARPPARCRPFRVPWDACTPFPSFLSFFLSERFSLMSICFVLPACPEHLHVLVERDQNLRHGGHLLALAARLQKEQRWQAAEEVLPSESQNRGPRTFPLSLSALYLDFPLTSTGLCSLLLMALSSQVRGQGHGSTQTPVLTALRPEQTLPH